MTNKSKSKPQPRFGKLDGKPPTKPRGRHARASGTAIAAVAGSEGEPKRETITLPPTARLGYRISEFAHLCGVSVPTVYRGIRDKKVDVIEVAGVRLVPRSFAIKLGLITRDDAI